MPTNPPYEDDEDDEDDYSWPANWPEFGDPKYLDPVLQAEHDRLDAEEEDDDELPVPAPLAPDLEELIDKIRDVRVARNAYVKNPVPYKFDRFRCYDILRGGMGLVIEARDPVLDRKVAIKLWMQSGPDAQAALLAEARILAKFRHPNVVAIYEPGIWNGRIYFVMDWIDGINGEEWMEELPSWQDVRRVFMAAGTGLAAAHDAGIQHRDFKPSNILVGDDGRVVVADFGIADSLHAIVGPDEAVKIEGTPVYMAPERLRGKWGDGRSDQFSFCVAMWRALYQQRPYAGQTGEELLESIERGELSETPGVEVPAWLKAVVRRGIADDPDERFGDMHELLLALSDEPPEEEEAKEADEGLVVGGVAELDGVLHKSGVHEPVREHSRWAYFATALLSAAFAVAGVLVLVRPSTREPTVSYAVEVSPYHAILERVSADEFEEAGRLWLEHESELNETQSLHLAETCLTRAKQLAPVDPVSAKRAALTAYDIAVALERVGSTAETREAGGQLAADALDQTTVDRPIGTY